MKISFSTCRGLLHAIFAMASTITVAHAQAYPTKPVRIIVPVTAGTTGDTLVRAV